MTGLVETTVTSIPATETRQQPPAGMKAQAAPATQAQAAEPAEDGDPQTPPAPETVPLPQPNEPAVPGQQPNVDRGRIELQAEEIPSPEFGVPDLGAPPTGADQPVLLGAVVESVHNSYPLLELAYQENRIAAGNQLAAWGAFDRKLKGASINQPLGFYETYRQDFGFEQPLYRGGEVFGGYRIGRGEFEPWYKERETNEGGEFKAGVRVPLMRNRAIDARRAELWRATYERQRVVPAIRAQLIFFVRDASVVYWDWVAAGQRYEIQQRALELARERNSRIAREVEEGEVDPPVLTDNRRAIAERQAKLIDAARKLEQSAIKLSLFLRQLDGQPVVPEQQQLPEFPAIEDVPQPVLDADIQTALQQRPELAAIAAETRQVNVDLAEAQNDMLPNLDAQIVGGQDVGRRASSTGDKSEFELEVGLLFDMPVQRRKALGKMQAARGKLAQLAAKRQFTADKIVTDVQAAYANLLAALDRVDQAREAVALAEELAEVERRKFTVGESDLLSLFLREQFAIEAAESRVDALLEYFVAQADYAAALAIDFPPLALATR